jgi:hypothetical protein
LLKTCVLFNISVIDDEITNAMTQQEKSKIKLKGKYLHIVESFVDSLSFESYLDWVIGESPPLVEMIARLQS